jgi:hypothetical protein
MLWKAWIELAQRGWTGWIARPCVTLQRRRDRWAVQSAGAGTQAETNRRPDGDIESGGTGRSRSGVDKIVRWRIVDLCLWVEERWRVSYSETGMLRHLWSLDLSHRKTRPRHPQSSEKAQRAFKKGGLPPA